MHDMLEGTSDKYIYIIWNNGPITSKNAEKTQVFQM